MKLSPIAYIILPSRFKILTKTKYALQKLPKYFKILQKWRNFAKSGHTTYQLPLARIRDLFFLLQRRDLESIINQNLSGNRKQWILLNNLNRQHSRLKIAQKRARLPSVHAKKSASQVALIAAEYLIIDFVVQIR